MLFTSLQADAMYWLKNRKDGKKTFPYQFEKTTLSNFKKIKGVPLPHDISKMYLVANIGQNMRS